MSVNTMRFRVRKAAGSPSVKGAGGIETLASHTCNPSAHPDYLRKGSLPQGFDRTEHLASKLDHCANYLRRAEVISSKLDYEKTKSMNLTDSSSNYAASKGTLRYVVTSYVLNQVLTDLGLTDTNAFFRKANIVNMSSVPPVVDLASYVPGYDVYKALTEQVTNHTHDVSAINGAMTAIGFEKSTDTTFRSGVNYYQYNATTHEMNVATVSPGVAISGTYYRKSSERTKAIVREFTYDATKAGTPVNMHLPTTEFNVEDVNCSVDLIGTSRSGATYVYPHPTANVGTTSTPDYVSADSLVFLSSGSMGTNSVNFRIPTGWREDMYGGYEPSTMSTLKVRITLHKRETD